MHQCFVHLVLSFILYSMYNSQSLPTRPVCTSLCKFHAVKLTQTSVLCVLSGYLSCCRFIDDNQIITSSGDTTWWVTLIQTPTCHANTFSRAHGNSVRSLPPVHCGTSRRVSRPRSSRATAATSWACPCRPTCAPLCREPATPRSSCGTSGTACAGRPSQATSRTSTPSVWVSSGHWFSFSYTKLNFNGKKLTTQPLTTAVHCF